MKTRRTRLMLAAVVLFVTAALNQDLLAQVHDRAAIFSSGAVAEATKTIEKMKDEHKHVLLIETYPSIPAEFQAEFKAQSKDKFFADWAEKCRRAEKANGVVILICMNPRHAEIVVGNVTQRHFFTQKDRLALEEVLLPLLRRQFRRRRAAERQVGQGKNGSE